MLNLSTHTECLALSSVFQGGLCEKATSRPGRSFQPDEIIYSIGAESRSIYYLRLGLVKITALSEDGKEIILNVHKAGEIFGEFCLCHEERNQMAVAMEPSEVVEIKFEDLLAQLQQSPEVAYGFLLSVTERLSKAYQVICEFSFDNLPERLAKSLLRLADEFGRQTPGGTEITHYITQEELAQMVSARREVVSAALSRLRERGLIDYSRKGKMTINRPALLAFSEGKNDWTPSVAGRSEKFNALGN